VKAEKTETEKQVLHANNKSTKANNQPT